MKHNIVILIIYLLTFCSTLATANTFDKDFIYATYTVGARLSSVKNISSQNVKEFDFVYLVASPQWEGSDFDGEQTIINEKYIASFQYTSLFNNNYVPAYIDSVHKAGKKVLCSFPGRKLVEIASDSQRRAKFATMMGAFIKKYNYDGIELDWEQTITIPLHMAFMKDIREALNALGLSRQLYLTTALHPHHQYTKEQADELSSYVDWINIMFYDMGGGCWGARRATHNAPLNEMKALINNWKNFSPKKICIGLASYGFYYKDLAPKQQTAEGKTLEDHGRYCNYTELPELLKQGWYEQWDETEDGSFFIAPNNKEFMTLETPRSLDAKLKWIEECGFRGAFWWEFHCDWVTPATPQQRGKHLIMDYVTKKIRPTAL